MKTHQFRIGNLLQDQNGKICVVDKIHDHIFNCYSRKQDKTKKPYKAIDLNDKWLLDFEFERIGNEFSFNGYIIEKIHNEYYYTAGEGVKLSKEIKYVHILQNNCFFNQEIELTHKTHTKC